jgi:hypothetical protein
MSMRIRLPQSGRKRGKPNQSSSMTRYARKPKAANPVKRDLREEESKRAPADADALGRVIPWN